MCDVIVEPGGYPRGCPECAERGRSGRLEVVYDIPTIDEPPLPADERYTDSMWRYRRFLPLLANRPVTLGEGSTPLVSASPATVPDGIDVYLKNETTNPTWSFKDRLNSLLISNTIALGETYIVTASTGNHGASTAAYAARADIEDVIVLIPPDTEKPHHVQLRSYGAAVAVTDYESRKLLVDQLVNCGWYPTVSVTDEYVGLPYSYEAYKTIAFEIVDEFGHAPAAVTVPIGAGDGLYGVWKGFRELREAGTIDSTPRMYGVQPAERPSVIRALESGSESVGLVNGSMPITTSTSGPTAGDHALQAIRESAGDAYGVERSDVEAAIRTIGQEGIFVEPASALSLAGVEYMVADGAVDDGEDIVCLATGAGVKWPDHTRDAVGTAPMIEPTIESLEHVLGINADAPRR